MFESVEPAPPDPIFGLNEAFKEDPNPVKVNLTAGIYLDEEGRTPVFAAVKTAERRILEEESTKSYLGIPGSTDYVTQVQRLALGRDHPALAEARVTGAHTPGGTGALRVAGDFIRSIHPDATVWLTNPTWVNHGPIFLAAGLEVRSFPYFDRDKHVLSYEEMLTALTEISAGDVVVLQGCCHNPSGTDPSTEQWREIGELLANRGALPLLDTAYQGFGDSVEEDAQGQRILSEIVPEILICNSFSKNFGLYNERVGALILVTTSSSAAQAALSHLKRCIRANYSNPPAHGSKIVTTVLEDEALRQSWSEELGRMRHRIRAAREQFVEALDERGVHLAPGGNTFITRQRGMFSFSGLSVDQVLELKEKHSVYIVASGRISIAGMTPGNIDRVCDAIAALG
ncbi:MAG: aspartate/tyrosine/aromatic aminotransferase [Acidobacteria bacterium]|nr:MAG: aspartate/tyrosine/aromatic aminotransferase [Acidobacteriota bacterium]